MVDSEDRNAAAEVRRRERRLVEDTGCLEGVHIGLEEVHIGPEGVGIVPEEHHKAADIDFGLLHTALDLGVGNLAGRRNHSEEDMRPTVEGSPVGVGTGLKVLR